MEFRHNVELFIFRNTFVASKRDVVTDRPQVRSGGTKREFMRAMAEFWDSEQFPPVPR